jgi:hemolysin D
MNAPVKQPKQAPQTTGVLGKDREFLPAAIEILETPPAPRSVAFMLTICAFAVIAVAWSFIGKLDVHAVAWGKIEANGRSKVIQPLETGKIAVIHVENGKMVRAGEPLLIIDPVEAIADEKNLGDALSSARAEIVRRRAAVDFARNTATRPLETVAPVNRLTFPEGIAASIGEREQAVLQADTVQLVETLRNIGMQIAQRDASRKRLNMGIAAQNELIQTLEERVGVRSTTYKLRVGTSLNLFDAQEALHKSKVQLAYDKGQLTETDAAIAELQSQKAKAVAQFVAENQTRLADADRKSEEISQQLAKARARLARTVLSAPIDGIVQQLAVTTIGQVVTTGQQLMILAPANSQLQAEAFVSNIDIGFVKVGQKAEVKIDSFPFTRFGTIKAEVVKVAREAIDEQEAKRLQANPLAPAIASSNTSSPAVGQPQSFVFPITLALEETSVKVGNNMVPLSPGMTISVEIKTDSRRVIDYLLSPISKISSEAMRER